MSLSHSNANVRMPGAPQAGQASRLVSQEQVAMQSDKYAWNNTGARVGEVVDDAHWKARQATNFPVVPFDYNPRDTYQEAKWDMLGAKGGKNIMGQVQYSDADIEYMINKSKQVEYAQYDDWVGQKFDMTDPAQVALLRSIHPSYFERRSEVIGTAIDLTARYAKLKLFGIQSEDDLKLEYMVESGKLNLPRGTLWDPESWREKAEQGTTNAARYSSGLFNPWRVTQGDKAGWKANPKNYYDARGVKDDWFSGGLPGFGARSQQPYQAGKRATFVGGAAAQQDAF